MPMSLSPIQKSYQKSYGLLFGAIFAAVIALMWTGIFSSYIGGAPRVALLVLLLSISVVSALQGVYLFVKYPLPRGVRLPYLRSWRFWAKFYAVIVVEFIVIFALIRALDARHLQNGMFPLIVFVVGLHFYPLAKLNGNKIWYGTASMLCASIAVLIIFASSTATTRILDAPNGNVWALASSGVMVVIMIATSLISGQLYRRNARLS